MAGGDFGGKGGHHDSWSSAVSQQLNWQQAQQMGVGGGRQAPAGTSTPVDATTYATELMNDIRTLQRLQQGVAAPTRPDASVLRHTHQLLCRELNSLTAPLGNLSAGRVSLPVSDRTAPYRPPALRHQQLQQQVQQHHQLHQHMQQQYNHHQHRSEMELASVNSSSLAMAGLSAGGDREMYVGQDHRGRPHTLESRLPIPTVEGINFIGRIVGPRGITVKQMEQMYGCKILVRGQGSVKDVDRERRLIGRFGWEHLTEPLHVHVSATDRSHNDAQIRLDATVKELRKLLTAAGNDQLKHVQLMELAIINGTYRPLPSNHFAVKPYNPKSQPPNHTTQPQQLPENNKQSPKEQKEPKQARKSLLPLPNEKNKPTQKASA